MKRISSFATNTRRDSMRSTRSRRADRPLLDQRLRESRPDGEHERRRRRRQQPQWRGRDVADERGFLAQGSRRREAKVWFRARCTRMTAASGSSVDSSTSFNEANADAYRADLSVGFGEFFDAIPGRITLYTQTLGEGYSAPGSDDADGYGAPRRHVAHAGARQAPAAREGRQEGAGAGSTR